MYNITQSQGSRGIVFRSDIRHVNIVIRRRKLISLVCVCVCLCIMYIIYYTWYISRIPFLSIKHISHILAGRYNTYNYT